MFFSTWPVPDLSGPAVAELEVAARDGGVHAGGELPGPVLLDPRAQPGQVLGGAEDRGDDVARVAVDCLLLVGDLVQKCPGPIGAAVAPDTLVKAGAPPDLRGDFDGDFADVKPQRGSIGGPNGHVASVP
jgi:hypothetical protein